MSAKTYWNGLPELFGSPLSEPRSFLERLFIRPSAATRARGYYLRFLLSGWISSFTAPMLTLLAAKVFVLPLACYVYRDWHLGTAGVYFSAGAVGVIVLAFARMWLRPVRLFLLRFRCRIALARGTLPPANACILPDMYSWASLVDRSSTPAQQLSNLVGNTGGPFVKEHYVQRARGIRDPNLEVVRGRRSPPIR